MSPAAPDRRKGFAAGAGILFCFWAVAHLASTGYDRSGLWLIFLGAAVLFAAAFCFVVAGGLALVVQAGVEVVLILALTVWRQPLFGRTYWHGAEPTVIAALRTLVAVEEQYKASYGQGLYGSLADLGRVNPPFIDSFLSSGVTSGYSFAGAADGGTNFTFHATPLRFGLYSARSFFVDGSGIIRARLPGPATAREAGIDGELAPAPAPLTPAERRLVRAWQLEAEIHDLWYYRLALDFQAAASVLVGLLIALARRCRRMSNVPPPPLS